MSVDVPRGTGSELLSLRVALAVKHDVQNTDARLQGRRLRIVSEVW